MTPRAKLTAYVGPMAVFIGLLALTSVVRFGGDSFWLQHSEYWVFPLQTVVCGLMLWWYWKVYQLERPRILWFGFVIGLLVFLIWIAPQALLRFAPRTDGFNPDLFATQPAVFWFTVAFRFLRLVVVVPLVEEIFWRGFLLRYLINEEFDRVPIGTFGWVSFVTVTLAFALAHSMPDWPAAIITGMLYNLVVYRTKSLATCVVTHALTNLLLGLWIMETKQWGFW